MPNLLPNASFIGAVVGTPGTLPFDCLQGGGAGLTINVIGFTGDGTHGVDATSGTPYIDLQLNGTASDTNCGIIFSGVGVVDTVTVTPSTQYTASMYLARTAGSNPASATYTILFNEFSGFTYGTTTQSSDITLTATPTRSTYSPTLGANNGVQVYFNINYSASTVFTNVTYRIAGIQFEPGASATTWTSTPFYSSRASNTGTTTVVVSKPTSGWLAGNTLVAVVATYGTATVPSQATFGAAKASATSGSSTTQTRLAVFALTLSAVGPASYTFTTTGASAASASITEFPATVTSGFDAGVTVATNTGTTATALSFSAITTSVANELVFLAVGLGTVQAMNGWTSPYLPEITLSGANAAQSTAAGRAVAAGSTGALAATLTASAVNWVTATLAFSPPITYMAYQPWYQRAPILAQ